MFKTFSTITVLGLLALSAAQAQYSQVIHGKVPFAFTVQNTTLPAGNYQLTYSKTADILAIRGLDENSGGAFVAAIPTVGADNQARLVFHCYAKSCFLAQVWQGSGAGGRGLEVLHAHRERRLSFETRVLSMAAK